MESNSQMNRIHCSERTAEILAKQWPELPLKARGPIPIKGEGEMNTFWVNESYNNEKPSDNQVAMPEQPLRHAEDLFGREETIAETSIEESMEEDEFSGSSESSEEFIAVEKQLQERMSRLSQHLRSEDD